MHTFNKSLYSFTVQELDVIKIIVYIVCVCIRGSFIIKTHTMKPTHTSLSKVLLSI